MIFNINCKIEKIPLLHRFISLIILKYTNPQPRPSRETQQTNNTNDKKKHAHDLTLPSPPSPAMPDAQLLHFFSNCFYPYADDNSSPLAGGREPVRRRRSQTSSAASTSSSELSVYWIAPIYPSNTRINLNDPIEELPLHDGAVSPSSRKASITSDSQLRNHVFGTPTSQAGVVDGPRSAQLELRSVGMNAVRDSTGKAVNSSGSVGSVLRNESPLESISSRGGCGDTAWVLLDQPRALLPENYEEFMTNCCYPKAEDLPMPPIMDLSTPPEIHLTDPKDRRPSGGSKFKEVFPRRRKPLAPLKWIKERARAKTMKEDASGDGEDFSSSLSLSRKLRRRITNVMSLPGIKKQLRANTFPPENSPVTKDKKPALAPSDEQFLERLDDALTAEKPKPIRRLTESMQEAGRRFSNSGGKSTLPSATKKEESILGTAFTLPPRAQSCPPIVKEKNTSWDFEYLPSEARGVKTPTELPTFRPKKLGGKVMSRPKEISYFNYADMVQSKPPLAPPGEFSGAIDPMETFVESVGPPARPLLPMHKSGDTKLIAPFIDQDHECKELAPIFAKAKAVLFSTGQKIRRASLDAKNGMTRKDIKEASEPRQDTVGTSTLPGEISASPPTALSEGIPPPPPHEHTEDAITTWVIHASEGPSAIGVSNPPTETTQRPDDITASLLQPHKPHAAPTSLVGPIKPAEVVLEEARRQARDSGVIGLDPASPYSSSGDSFTYAVVARDIAGLSKRPKGPPATVAAEDNPDEGRKREPEIGELVTPAPPGFPAGQVPPGSFIRVPGEGQEV
jgi:hypothetical protein